MPGAATTKDIELIIEPVKGGGSGNMPPRNGRGGGDGDGKRRGGGEPSSRKYYAGMGVAIVAVLMFFMALASAFLVLKGRPGWVPVRIPALIWFNTAVLLASSGTLELARKRLGQDDAAGFRKFWLATTVLGAIFLVGQVVAWRQLEGQGIYLASNPASSFFYVFTGLHAAHLLGGVAGLIYVRRRQYAAGGITLPVAAEVTSYYWHFMDALWVFLLVLLLMGR